MDMSKSEKASMDILRGIMDWGPLTLYSANSKTKLSIGTLYRHIKQLEETGKIRIYESNTKGRKKIKYGPTLYGMIILFRKDKKFADSIENYFLIWIENKEFQKELEKEGFDISGNLSESKFVFREYMEYFSAIEDLIESIRKGDNSVSRDILILISSSFLSSDPYYKKLWEDLYHNLPGMKKSLDEYMRSMIKNYNDFKKDFIAKK